MIEVKTRITDKTPQVKKRIAQSNIKSVQHAAAMLRKTILWSIRKGRMSKSNERKPSRAGSPPKTWSNRSGRRMKRDILYTSAVQDIYGKSHSTVYARPEEHGESVYQMHEFGGSQIVYTRRKTVQDRNERKRNYNPKPLDTRSEAEQKHIKDYYANIKREKADKVAVKAAYAKRPFMLPAVKKIMPKLPRIWQVK
ncbi:MAG: hypothetical protein LBQ66_00350 [Planctomycetaceae bacterium]|jgi:hypothetical protein|nr:hypothetical protein [Planctomycetaceae bacterium]